MKRLAIFDFDGTLFNSVDDVIICFNKALEKLDFDTLTREDFIGCLGGNIDEIVSLVLKDKNTPKNAELLKSTYLGIYYPAKKENTLPFAGAHDFLKKLQDMGVILAINSNRFSDSLEFFVENFFSDINFIEIEGHNFDTPSKPSPAGVNKIIKKAGVTKDETVYIGDSSTDIKTAQNAEVDCIIVRWGYGDENDWKNEYPLECVDDFSQMLKYF